MYAPSLAFKTSPSWWSDKFWARTDFNRALATSVPLVRSIGDLLANRENPGIGRTMDSRIFRRWWYGRPVKELESSRRISKNTSARWRVPPSEASDLKEHCELGDAHEFSCYSEMVSQPELTSPASLRAPYGLCASDQLRCFLQDSEFSKTLKNILTRERRKKQGCYLPSILPVTSEKATISASSITSLMMQGIPFLLPKGTTEPGRPRASKITLGVVGVSRALLLDIISLLVDGISIVRRFPLTLAKDLQFHRSRPLVDLDMDLGAFTVVLGFGPDQL